MSSRDPRQGRLLLAGALLTVVLLQVLRVWLPSVPMVVGRGGTPSALVLAVVAVAWLAAPLAATRLLGGALTWRVLLSAAGLLGASRLVLQLTSGGWPQLTIAGVGTVAGVVALMAWATVVDGHAGRVAVLVGVVADVSVRLALATLDLVWRPGAGAAALVALLVAAAFLAIPSRPPAPAARTSAPDALPTGTARGPAWPWLALAPLLTLVATVSAVPGRAALATSWPTALLAGVLAGGHVLAVVAALVGPRVGAGRCGTWGAGLVLVGAAGALRPVSGVTVAAQVALAIGVGLAVGALARVPGAAPARRVAAAVAAAWLGTGLLLHGSHAWHELATRIDARYLLVLAAALLGAMALAGARRAAPPEGAPGRRQLLPAAVAVTVVALLTTTVAAVVGPRSADQPRPDRAADELVLALLNLQLGYDLRGRYDPIAQADALADLGPDLVVLNEVDRGWLLGAGHDTGHLVGSRLGRDAVFAPAGHWLHGDALLTDLPLDDVNRARLPRGPRDLRRGLVSAIVEVGDGQQLAVVATRLHAVEAHADIRRRQARAVAAEVARLLGRGHEVVLLGDLQAEPQDPELEPLTDLLSPAVPLGRATWPSWQPRRQLDQVLISDGLEVVGHDVVVTGVSDHLPVAVRLRRLGPDPIPEDR